MTQKMTRRGYDPDDSRLLPPAAQALLESACREIEFLLDQGYPKDPAVAFVGSHHQLTARQRLALHRTAASADQSARRRARSLPAADVRNSRLLVDGFNQIITLEVALSGSPVILGRDGALRDLAGLRGTYRLIPQTAQAILLIGRCLQDLCPAEVIFCLDASVSNSGRLRSLIREMAAGWGIPVHVELVPDADRELMGQSGVVTSDSAILDHCVSWFNMTGQIIERAIPDAWVIRLSNSCPHII